MIDSCFAPYAFKHVATAPFGPEEAPNQWTHSTMAQLDASSHRGHFARYDGGGYVVDLPSNHTAALLAVEQLEQQGFVDRATRVIFVDLSAFNANVGMFYSARPQGQSAPPPLGSAAARLLRLLRARVAALGSSALPGKRPSHWARCHRLGCSR